MSGRRRIVVVGLVANMPYAGMAWMHGQFLMGFKRLGHEVYYIEATTDWSYDPLRLTYTKDPGYAVSYLSQVMEGFGLPEAWAYRAAYAGDVWYGPQAGHALELMRSADAVLNISGSTRPEDIGVPCPLVYVGTDPVLQELRIANGDDVLRARIAAHQAHFTYGENIGAPDCPVPPLPFPTHTLRQPIVLSEWVTGEPPRPAFTTVTNWEVKGYDVEWRDERYTWSKADAFRRVMTLPARTSATLELALGLSGVSDTVRAELVGRGWMLADAFEMSLRPWPYREYIRGSMAEFSVAKDMVARTRSGWFSERSACYLAAGRPVVTEDTGFGCALPVGDGLLPFRTLDEAVDAIEAVRGDYARHSRAACAIAEECFRAETVLTRMLGALGL